MSANILIRGTLQATPTDPQAQNVWQCESPDIITKKQASFVPDAAKALTTAANLANGGLSEDVVMQDPNWVYIRAQNMTSAQLDATLSLFYCESDLAMWPQNWKQAAIYYNVENTGGQIKIDSGTPINYAPVTLPPYTGGDAKTGWTANDPGFIWTPPLFHTGHSQGDHYCLIAFAQDGHQTKPFDPSTLTGGQKELANLVALVRDNPNMAWHNTHDIYLPPGEIATWTRIINITGATNPCTINVRLEFDSLYPGDGKAADQYGTFSLQIPVPGKDGQDFVNITKQQVGKINPWWPLNLPENAKTTAILQYFQGNWTPPTGANIRMTATVNSHHGPTPPHHGREMSRQIEAVAEAVRAWDNAPSIPLHIDHAGSGADLSRDGDPVIETVPVGSVKTVMNRTS